METIHPMDTDAEEEKALCGADAPSNDLTGVDHYLKRRRDGLPVGTVCKARKARTVQWAANWLLELDADGLTEETSKYH